MPDDNVEMGIHSIWREVYEQNGLATGQVRAAAAKMTTDLPVPRQTGNFVISGASIGFR
jgi:hypothetical protein